MGKMFEKWPSPYPELRPVTMSFGGFTFTITNTRNRFARVFWALALISLVRFTWLCSPGPRRRQA